LDQPGADGIHLHIAKRLPEVIFIQRAGKKAILPKMARQAALNVLPTGVIIIQLAHAPG
jgi:hypothetical protein